MKRASIFLLGVLAVAAAYTGASWYLGTRIEARAKDALEQVRAGLRQHGIEGLTLTLEEQSYERGVFSSAARYLLAYERRGDEDHPEPMAGQLVFVNEISHGPLGPLAIRHGQLVPGLAHVRTTLANEAQAERLFALTGGRDPLEGLTLVHFNGGAHTHWTLAGFDSEQEGESITFSGADFSSSVSADRQTLTARGGMARLSIETPEQSLAVHDVRLAANTRAGSLGLGVGDSNITVGSFELQPPDAPLISLEKLSSRSAVSEAGEHLAAETVYAVDKIGIGAHDFGSLQFGLKAERLDAQALRALSEQYGLLLQESGASETGQPSAQTLAAFDAALDRVLASKPVLTLDPVAWKTAQGESRLDVVMNLRHAPAEGEPVAPQLERLEALQANVSISQPMAVEVMSAMLQNQGAAPEDAAETAAAQVQWLAGLVQSAGWAVAEDGRLTMQLSYADGKATLNGREQALDELLPGLGVPGLSDGLGLDEPAEDGPALQHIDPATIVRMLQDEGYTVNRTVDAAGDPLIEILGDSEGPVRGAMTIEFYGCQGPTQCDDMLLRAIHRTDGPADLQAINDWNATNRWARAYRGEGGEAILEVDIEVLGGLGQQALDTQLFGFFELSDDLADTLGVAPRY